MANLDRLFHAQCESAGLMAGRSCEPTEFTEAECLAQATEDFPESIPTIREAYFYDPDRAWRGFFEAFRDAYFAQKTVERLDGRFLPPRPSVENVRPLEMTETRVFRALSEFEAFTRFNRPETRDEEQRADAKLQAQIPATQALIAFENLFEALNPK